MEQLEKDVAEVRAYNKHDPLGSTFMELMLRCAAVEDNDWLESNAYAFFMGLATANPEASASFANGIGIAAREIMEGIENGRSTEDDDEIHS